MKIAVVGATGMVGQVMLQVLHERGFDKHDIIAVASERSVGKEIAFADKTLRVIGLADAVKVAPDIALFSAGGTTSKLVAMLLIILPHGAWKRGFH